MMNVYERHSDVGSSVRSSEERKNTSSGLSVAILRDYSMDAVSSVRKHESSHLASRIRRAEQAAGHRQGEYLSVRVPAIAPRSYTRRSSDLLIHDGLEIRHKKTWTIPPLRAHPGGRSCEPNNGDCSSRGEDIGVVSLTSTFIRQCHPLPDSSTCCCFHILLPDEPPATWLVPNIEVP